MKQDVCYKLTRYENGVPVVLHCKTPLGVYKALNALRRSKGIYSLDHVTIDVIPLV